MNKSRFQLITVKLRIMFGAGYSINSV